MPQPRVLDLTERSAEPSGVENFFSRLGKSYKDQEDRVEIGKLLSEYKQNREDANAWEDLQLNLEQSNISPSRRLQAQASLNEIKKTIISKDKSLNSKVDKNILTAEEKTRQKGNLIKAGWPEYAADVYLDSPPGVKQTMEREHAELTARGFRKPLVGIPEETNSSQITPQTSQQTKQFAEPQAALPVESVFVDEPETKQEKKDVLAAAPIPDDEWAPPIVPKNLTEAERVKWENNNEKENNKELKETQNKKKAYAQNDILINSMTQINDTHKLPKGMGSIVIDPSTGDLRPEAQLIGSVNTETQVYVKNLKQFLKGAKDFFGARVTNFDVSSFMAQLPSLLNSEQGRRIILKQMKYVNDLESIHNNTLNQGLKKYGRNANYNQVVQEADRKVAEREKDLMGKINNLVGASSFINQMAEKPEQFKDMTLMQRPDGSFAAVPNAKVEKLKTKKWRDF